MIPHGISKKHLAHAVAKIQKDGVPPARKSVRYDYMHSGKRYPPKYVISLAAKFAFGYELSSGEFNAVAAKDYLRSRGHTVIDRREEALAKVQPEDDESAFKEGAVLYKMHRSRERNQRVAKIAKENRWSVSGSLVCYVCSFDFAEVYGELGVGFIEAHHTIPVAELNGKSKTKVSDLELLCSNCHRMLHRQKNVMSVKALRELVRKRAGLR